MLAKLTKGQTTGVNYILPKILNLVKVEEQTESRPRTVNHPDATVSSAGVEVEKGDSMKDSRDENGPKTRCINESSADVPITDNDIEGEYVGNDGKTENLPLSTGSYGMCSFPFTFFFSFFRLISARCIILLQEHLQATQFCPLLLPLLMLKKPCISRFFIQRIQVLKYNFKNLPDSDSADTTHVGGDASIEHNLIILDNPDWRNLEESCIFVDVDGCRSDALSRGKCRSYKKTIRDAFLSTKKASRTQEFEKLAALYGDPKSTQDCS